MHGGNWPRLVVVVGMLVWWGSGCEVGRAAGKDAGAGAAASEPGQGLVDCPEYVSWAKCKPGTRVVYKKVSSGAAMPAAPAPAEIAVEMVLVSVTAEKVTLQVNPRMVVNGNEVPLPGGKDSIPAKTKKEAAMLPRGLPPGKISHLKVDEETVEVGGKKYKGERRDFDFQVGDASIHLVTVMSKDVPNLLLRSEQSTKAPEAGEVMTLIKVDLP